MAGGMVSHEGELRRSPNQVGHQCKLVDRSVILLMANSAPALLSPFQLSIKYTSQDLMPNRKG